MRYDVNCPPTNPDPSSFSLMTDDFMTFPSLISTILNHPYILLGFIIYHSSRNHLIFIIATRSLPAIYSYLQYLRNLMVHFFATLQAQSARLPSFLEVGHKFDHDILFIPEDLTFLCRSCSNSLLVYSNKLALEPLQLWHRQGPLW